MPSTITANSNIMILTTQQSGITVIPSSTPLARLNYFDGKFLRAEDLRTEQLYLRNLVRLSNKTSGHGVANGFSVTQGSGDQLLVSPGLAVNAEGQIILLGGSVTVSLGDLIDKTRQAIVSQPSIPGLADFGDCSPATATPPSQVLETGDLFVITVAPAEALCGQEDVYGKLCEDACVTSTDRPLIIEGIVLRARPLQLSKPLPISSAFPFSQAHLRSRVASVVFAQEPTLVANLISKSGLESDIWCLGAQADGGTEVPLAVVDRAGASIVFLDAWTVRREKIDTVAKRYWQWRMAMRPWDVYLAQILQFQCQLSDLLQDGPAGSGGDPCASAKDLVKEAATRFDQITQFYGSVASKLAQINVGGIAGGLGLLSSFQSKLADFTKLFQTPTLDRRLLRGGIVELPSAGYLPVVPGSAATINAQVRQWMGEGVDLRFCIVRPDFVPHALEEAQHMERISLTQGLDDPTSKPQVDILVPNGEILKQATASPGQGYEAVVQMIPVGAAQNNASVYTAPRAALNVQGAATTRALASGGAAFYLAGASVAPNAAAIKGLADVFARVGSSALTNVADLSTDANTQPVAVGTVGQNADLFTRLNVNAASAIRSIAALRAGTAVLAPSADDQPVGALWTQLSASENPFTLPLGGTTAVNLRIIAVLPGSSAVDYRVQGDLTITQPASGGATQTINGSVSGTFVVDDQTTPRGGSLRFDVKATYDPNANAVHVVILSPSITAPVIEFQIETGWQGSPQNIDTRVAYRILKGDQVVQDVQLLHSSLTRNDKVLEAGQSSHTAALSALDVIGSALKDASFSDSAARLLFPPPPPPTSDLLVRGTLDWVLFHRRRTKTCATETTNVVINSRRYQLFHLRVPNNDAAQSIIKALLNNDSVILQKAGFKAVDVLEFAAGAPALNTPLAAIQTDWTVASPPPAQIYYAAIVSQGAATSDGASLSLQRLSRLQDAVSTITPPSAQVRYETLPVVPTALAAPGLDGDIIVITIPTAPPVKYLGHEVLRTTQPLDRVVANIQKNGLAQTITPIPGAVQMAQDLGFVQFQEHTSTPKTTNLDGIQQTWTSNGGGDVAAGVTLFDANDNTEDAIIRGQQAQAICKQIGSGFAPAPTPISSVTPLTTSVTVLQVKTAVTQPDTQPDVQPTPQPDPQPQPQPQPGPNRTARILLWHPDPASASGQGRVLWAMASPVGVEFKADGSLAKALTATQAKGLQKFGPLVRVLEFFTADGPPDAAAASRTKAISAELEAKGFTLASSKLNQLPSDVKAIVPADAATAQDLIFLEVLG